MTTSLTQRHWPVALLLLTLGLTTNVSRATTITDAANDFIPTFAGAHSGDLDVLSVFANFDGTNFHIGATLNANVGTLPSALYVFGFNRGAGFADFASIGLPGVKFDAVITMTGTGVTGGRDLASNTAIALPANAVQISGATFQIDFAASLLPSLGLAPRDYGINLWPRDASVAAGVAQISDFAPDASDFTSNPAAVPEPTAALLFSTLLLAMAQLVRRERLLK